jgi:hypothetical protein
MARLQHACADGRVCRLRHRTGCRLSAGGLPQRNPRGEKPAGCGHQIKCATGSDGLSFGLA